MLTDRELDKMRHRYKRALGGTHGTPPSWLLDLGNALQEIDELHATVNTLVAEQEQEG